MGLVGIGLALGLAYSVYWKQLATGVEAGVRDWFQERRDEGWQATHEGLQVTGFPFSLAAEITAPRLARPGRWSWSGPALRGESFPWQPGRWTVLAPGRHEGSLSAEGVARNIVARLGFARAVVLVSGGRLRHAEATIEDARLHDVATGDETRLARLDLAAREPGPEPATAGRPPATLVTSLELENLDLAEGQATPFGRASARASSSKRARTG